MDAIALLRTDLEEAHKLLESTLGEPTPEQLHYCPPGRALPIGAAYAHVLFSEDLIVHRVLKGEPALYEGGVKTGASEPMPNFMAGEWDNYADWTKRVRFNLAELRAYGQQVYAATDAYVATLKEADLDREIPSWQMSLGPLIARGIAAHADNLAGEISAAKGVQGLQGYPF